MSKGQIIMIAIVLNLWIASVVAIEAHYRGWKKGYREAESLN